MKALHDIRTVYFLGIGGIGMSALARWFKARGSVVTGYDRTPGSITTKLQAEGIDVHFEDDPALVPVNPDLVVYTPAIPSDLRELVHVQQQAYWLMKRSEVLGMISSEMFTIAVAGTHGKTSVTSLIAWLLQASGKPVTAFIGGISRNFGTNLVLHPETDLLVAEADEFDRSFLRLKPDIAVITSLDADHLDIYGSREELLDTYRAFAQAISPAGILVRSARVSGLRTSCKEVSYGEGLSLDCHFTKLVFEGDRMKFVMNWQGHTIPDLVLNVPGRHNLENALAASAVCLSLGVEPDRLRKALAEYQGVERRFDYRIRRADLIYIDDYAHHPEELAAFISAVRELYPGRHITGIFQPHLFSRTRDFADGFARSLDLLDEAILMDIYPARELPLPGVDSGMILRRMRNPVKHLMTRAEIAQRVQHGKLDILLTMGAGDIDRLVPELEQLLNTAPINGNRK
jgi:UDP-N-acetylmuramate--alanine ligase